MRAQPILGRIRAQGISRAGLLRRSPVSLLQSYVGYPRWTRGWGLLSKFALMRLEPAHASPTLWLASACSQPVYLHPTAGHATTLGDFENDERVEIGNA
jgi:hypothetical protein